MAEQKVTLETKIKITGVQMAKGLKGGDLKVNIDQAHFKTQIDKAKAKLASAVAGMRVQPKLSVTKASLATLRKEIKNGLQGIQVGVKGGAGGAARIDGRQVARLNTLFSNMGDSLRNVNRGLRSLVNRLNSMGGGGRRGGGGGGGGGGGAGGGGGIPFGGGGAGGAGGTPESFLQLLTQVPALNKMVTGLSETFRRDLLTSLADTGKAGDTARARLVELIRTQEALSRAVGKGPRTGQAILGQAAEGDLKNRLKAEQEELKRTARIARETKAALQDLQKSGRRFESSKQFKELEKEAKKAGLTTEQLALSIDKVFGAGAASKGKGVDFGAFFGKGGSFKEFQATQRTLEKSSAEAARFGNIIQEVGRKAAVFRLASIAINSVATAIRSAGTFILEFDGRLRDINKILRLTEQGLKRVGATITSMAGNTGVASVEIAGVAEELSRAGLAGRGFGSVMELTGNILTGVQGTTLNATEATEFMIQTIGQLEAGMKGLQQELVTTTKGFDILGRAEDITASKASDVVNAFKRSGASLLATGATFEEITALISVAQERTRRGAEVIGTAFKTIGTRIANPASEASRALRSIGVATVDAQGNLRNIFDVIQDTERAFKGLTEAQQSSIAATVAGVRQVEIFRNVVNSAGRQLAVLNELETASGDAARKQAEEQRKLSVVIDQIGGKFQELVESARGAGLDTFFKVILGTANTFLGIIAKIDKALGGAFTGTGLAFALATGFALAVKIFRRLAIGFAQFLATLQTVPKITAAIGTSLGSIGQILSATAQATGANVGATQKWLAELQKVNAQMQAVSQAQTVGAAAPGAQKGGRVRGAASAIGGGLAAAGKQLTFGRLLGASVALGAVEEAARAMNSELIVTGAEMLQTATTGALLGSAFGPMGAAIGGITGSIIGLVTAFGTAQQESDRMSEKTLGAFSLMSSSVDALDFDAFAAAVGRANKGLTEVVKQLESLGETNVQKAAQEIVNGLSTIADPSLVDKVGTKERGEKINRQLGKLIGSALDIEGDFDINKITDVPGLDTGQLKSLIANVIAKKFGIPLEEAEKEVSRLIQQQSVQAANAQEVAEKLRGSINSLKQTDAFNAVFGFWSETGKEIQELRGLREQAQAQAAAATSTGGFLRIVGDFFARRAITPESTQELKQLQTDLEKGGKAAKFEIQNIFKDFFDLSAIKGGTGATDELESAFQAVGGFSRFANEFRESSASLLTNLGSLQEAFQKANAPLKNMAQLEATLAEQQLERLRVTTKLTQTAKVIKLLDTFSDKLGQLGEEGDKFEEFAKKVIGTVDFASRLSNVKPEEAMKRLAEASAEFVAEAKQFDNKDVVSSLDKLFRGAGEAIVKGRTKILQDELALRRKQAAGLKEQFTNLEKTTKKVSDSVKIEELRSKVLVNQLTGLDKLAAQEKALTVFTSARTQALEAEIAALQILGKGKITDENREKLNDQVALKERELTKLILDENAKRANLVKQGVNERVKIAKRDASFASSLLKGRARLVDLLGKEEKGLGKFARALSTSQEIFKTELNGLRSAMMDVASSTLPVAEREKKLTELRREEAKAMLDQAIAEAEILSRRRDAVKGLVDEGIQKQEELQQAQKQVFDATEQVSEAFNNYFDAVQGVISATTEYTVGLQLANVAAQKTVGAFRGINEQISAVTRIFAKAEQAARAVGAGEEIIADLRKQSIDEQIRLFNELLSSQQSAARSFFTSSREDQAELFRSIKTVSGLVESGIFGNNFDEFSKKGEDAINQIGAQLLALPQETRQGLLQAIETLSTLGVGVGGFSADQLQSIIDTVALGTNEDVDPLFEVQSRIANLIEEQARLQLDGIIAANEQVNLAKEQLTEAQGAKMLAEIQLERIKMDGERINARLGELRGSMVAAMSRQTSVTDAGFQSVVAALRGITSTSGVTGRSGAVSNAITSGSANQAALSGGVNASSLALANASQSISTKGSSNVGEDESQKTTNELLKRIEGVLTSKLDAQTAELTEIKEGQETTGAAATGTAGTPLQAEFNVQVDGNQTVRVTGLTEGIQATIDSIVNTFGPFVTESQVRDSILGPLLDQINKFLTERGLNVLGFQ